MAELRIRTARHTVRVAGELIDDEVRRPDSHREPNPRRLQVRFRREVTRIAYRHRTPPPMMRAHTGSHTLTKLPHAIRATAAHTVVLRHESTRDMVRQVPRDLSMAALGRAKRFAEARGPVRVGATQR